ncbi:hypothetical protein BCR42DRAFT_404596 [Absidia repens]|uniref:BHLH domain-containing protein n=1 Tax=Absidia repens TaxID=90262 RepID=A0A1X2IWE3_9FUNG|nr:hypothetical protein BCR42DRAFT_404596 [Absidia repens]
MYVFVCFLLNIYRRNMSSEKKRQRRESHNIVEQRRRDNISARIKELSELLPPPSSPHPQQKFNRGVVLQKSVEHIRLLQQLVLQQQEHIRELEALLEGTHHPTVLSGEHQPSSSSPSSSIAVYTGTTYTEAQ